ncbi:acyltransferase family protein [Pseudomonas guineae]|uniref:acyltransferase family protein n=1 Tax=Pseudomonas guineae TaxID=425504 RepID=UPI003D031101
MYLLIKESSLSSRNRSESTTRYRRDIDGLRAVAVLGVVFFHMNPAWLPGGYAGVDVFFVISGYLISLILLGENSQREFSFQHFYARRIRRLFPALLLVLLSVMIFGWFALLPSEYELLGKHVSSASIFLANFRLMGEVSYFDVAAHVKPLLHLWSLAVEEQFYIIWPILLVCAFRVRAPLLAVFISLVIISVIFSAWSTMQSASLHFFHPLSRFWELGVGCLLALFKYRGLDVGCCLPVVANLASSLGLALIAVAFLCLDTSMIFPGAWALLPVLGACLCIAFEGEGASRLLSSRIMVSIGLISYPLYLWHWPIFSYLRIIEGEEPTLLLMCIGLGLAMVLSIITYQFAEKPLRHSPKKTVLILLILAMVIVFLFGRAIRKADGFPERSSLSYMGEAAEQVIRAPSHDAQCLDYVGDMDVPFYCRLTEGDGSLLAVVGDSHAHVIYPGLSELRKKEGKGTLLLGNSGCPPLLGTTFGKSELERIKCSEQIDMILEKISSDPNITSVLLVTRGPIYITATGFGPAEASYSYPPVVSIRGSGESPRQVFKAGLVKTVEKLQVSGKIVSYMLQVPEIGIDPQACFGRPFSMLDKDFSKLCMVPYSSYKARMAVYRTLVDEVRQNKKLNIFDPERVFCTDEGCSALFNDRLRYADNNHLSVLGSQELAKALVPWLRALAQAEE